MSPEEVARLLKTDRNKDASRYGWPSALCLEIEKARMLTRKDWSLLAVDTLAISALAVFGAAALARIALRY